MPRGGHFAAAEAPELLAADIAGFFGALSIRVPQADRLTERPVPIPNLRATSAIVGSPRTDTNQSPEP